MIQTWNTYMLLEIHRGGRCMYNVPNQGHREKRLQMRCTIAEIH